MEFKINNWMIKDDLIVNSNLPHYEIDVNRLLEERRDGYYDWMLHIMSKGNLTNEDILDFNTVMLIVSIKKGLDIDIDLFIKSVNEQTKEMKLR